MAAWPLPVVGLVVVLAMTTLVWLASLVKRDASIIDVLWGLGFVVVGWVYFAAGDGQALRQPLVVGLVTLWGVRLSLHILWRNWGRGEDYRYREMREKNPEAFPLRSLLSVFWLQALLLWAIAMPLYQVQRRSEPLALTPLDVLALALYLLGFVFEAGKTLVSANPALPGFAAYAGDPHASVNLGSAQWFADGRVLVGWGEFNGAASDVSEFDAATGALSLQLTLHPSPYTNGYFSYRARKAP